MTRSIGLIAIMALLSACGTSAPPTRHIAEGHQPGEEAAVLEVLDRYVTAISESDLEAQAAMQTPDGTTYQWRPAEGGGMHITARPNPHLSGSRARLRRGDHRAGPEGAKRGSRHGRRRALVAGQLNPRLQENVERRPGPRTGTGGSGDQEHVQDAAHTRLLRLLHGWGDGRIL